MSGVGRVAPALIVLAALTGCIDTATSDETMPPLVPPQGTSDATTDGTSTEGTTFVTPLSVQPTAEPASSTTGVERQPVGDWDGARFDVGRVTGVDEVNSYPAVLFDRYSHDDPELGTLDANSFTEEPLRYWWQGNPPYFNQATTIRRFVLAADVTVLVLADDGRDAACASPPPEPLPEPTWNEVETSFLSSPNASQAFALLTYSEAGVVEQVRFTTGC